jgi:DNA-binding NtrC family response regulator
VIVLAERFLRRLERQYCKSPRSIAPEAVSRLVGYDWPGNVRELENLIHREFLLTDGPAMHLRGLEPREGNAAGPADSSGLTELSFRKAKATAIARFERAYITELLSRSRGNISLAARMSGKERSRLGKLVKKYGLERESFARAAEPA